MASFQGSGFQIDLPDDIVDASSYVFVRNDGTPSPPMLRISSQAVVEIPEDIEHFLKSTVEAECEVVPNLTLLDTSTNQRDNWTYAIANLAWGAEPESTCERRIYLFVDESPPRMFTLTVTAPKALFAEGNAYFAASLRSLTPNALQKLLPDIAK